MRVPKYLGSSVNENELSLTIKGLLLGLVPLALYLTSLAGVEVSSGGLTDIINQIFVGVSGLTTLVGLGRKIYVKLKK